MTPSSATFLQVLTKDAQVVVPIFQREYEWPEEKVKIFWNDLARLVDEPSRTHYMGAVVKEDRPMLDGMILSFMVIDGQQRFTTLMLLAAAVRDAVKDLAIHATDSYSTLTEQRRASDSSNKLIHLPRLLKGEYVKYVSDSGLKPKFLPTELNDGRTVYDKIVYTGAADKRKRHFKHYAYFKKAIGDKLGVLPDVNSRVAWLHGLLDSLSRMQIIYLTIDDSDDAQQIFESINYKGEPLSVTDLIRNHVMSIAPHEDRQRIFDEIWGPMDAALAQTAREEDGGVIRTSLFDEFFRAYVAMRKGRAVPNKELFSVFTEIVKDDAVSAGQGTERLLASLAPLRGYANTYQYLAWGGAGQPAEVQAVVARFSHLEFLTPMPLLMKAFGLEKSSYPTASEFDAVIKVLESFFVRRALLGESVKRMSDYFATLTVQYAEASPAHANFASWLGGRLRRVGEFNPEFKALSFVTDAELRHNMPSAKVYSNSRNATRYVLSAIERKRSTRETAAGLSSYDIEHVLPQEYAEHWMAELIRCHPSLGESAIHDQADLLGDTIGNLTLTNFNRALRNFSFLRKRDYTKENTEEKGYRTSNVRITRDDFGALNEWKFEDIRKRSSDLCEEMIVCFPYPVA